MIVHITITVDIQVHTRKLPLCIFLLLIVGGTTGQRSVLSKRDCTKTEYWNNGLCCDKCESGHRLVKTCSINMTTECEKCLEGTYQDKMNYYPNCFRCLDCTKRSHAVVISACTHLNNTVCGCQFGYRKRILDGISWDCVPFKRSKFIPLNSDQQETVVHAL